MNMFSRDCHEQLSSVLFTSVVVELVKFVELVQVKTTWFWKQSGM